MMFRKRNRGLTLIEIIVSTMIFAILVVGLINLFTGGKQLILHARSRMASAELEKRFLDPFHKSVRYDQWDPGSNEYSAGSPLRRHSETPGATVPLDGIDYNSFVTVATPPGFAATDPIRKVRVRVQWQERTVH